MLCRTGVPLLGSGQPRNGPFALGHGLVQIVLDAGDDQGGPSIVGLVVNLGEGIGHAIGSPVGEDVVTPVGGIPFEGTTAGRLAVQTEGGGVEDGRSPELQEGFPAGRGKIGTGGDRC